jgi:signal transduction histidine kinase
MRPALAHRLRDTRGAVFVKAISETEKVIAFCRVLLAATTLAIAIVDPKQPVWPQVAYPVLGGYVAFSLLLFLLVRGEVVRGRRVGPYSVVSDVIWAVLITLFTEGGATPFFLLNVFVISSVSIRYGFAASAPLTVLLACLYPVLIFFAGHWLDPQVFQFQRAHLFRPIYLVALGYLIGYLGEHERRSKRKLAFMLELTTVFRHGRAPGWGLTRLMRRVLHHFGASRALLVLRDPESKRYFTWDMARQGGRLRLGLRISEKDPVRFPFASATEAFLAHTAERGTGTALCYDLVSGAMQRRTIPSDLRLPGDDVEQALLVAPILLQQEIRGRAVVMRERRPRFVREDLQFLLLIVGQAAAGLEAVRLQEKAEEVAVLEERARIARDLHDGFIQSLAGIDLRVEACRLVMERDPGRLTRELAELQTTVDRGYREVRHYLSVLRSASREAHDLTSTLERVAAEFSMRDRLRVDLVLPPEDPGLSSSTSYEITQIVREALRNAVRHGQATEAVVRLAAYDGHCSLVIRDNGRGFQGGPTVVNAEGAVSAAGVPWSIRERTAALGGTLRVRSRPGQGVEVLLLIPMTSDVRAEQVRRRSA